MARITNRWELEESRKKKKQQAIQTIKEAIDSGSSYKGNTVVNTVTPKASSVKSSPKSSAKSSSGSSSRSSSRSSRSSSRNSSSRSASSADTRPAGARIPEFLQGPRTAQPKVQPILTRAGTVYRTPAGIENLRKIEPVSVLKTNSTLPRVAGTTATQRAIDLTQLMKNSTAWHFADDAEKERLYQANNSIRQKYGLQYSEGDTFLPSGVNLSDAQNLMGHVSRQRARRDNGVPEKTSSVANVNSEQAYSQIDALFNRSGDTWTAQDVANRDIAKRTLEKEMDSILAEYGLTYSKNGIGDTHPNIVSDETVIDRLRQMGASSSDIQLIQENIDYRSRLDRISQGAKAVWNRAVASIPALVETIQQQASNVEESRKNPEYVQLEAEAQQLENQLTGMQSTNYDGTLNQDYMDIYNRWQDVRRRLDELTVKTPVDQNKTGQRMLREANEAQANATAGLDDTSRMLANTGISIAGNAPTMALSAIPGAGPVIGSIAMGLNAAGQRTQELNERGYAPSEALGRGILSGSIEALTEKIPLDEMADILRVGGKTFVKTALRQVGIESGEEGASYMLNFVADWAANDPEAKFSFSELAQSMIGGGLSGLFFSTTGYGANKLANIDSGSRVGYNGINGGVSYGGQSDGNGNYRAGVSPLGADAGGQMETGRNDGRRNPVLAGRDQLVDSSTRQIMNERGIVDFGLRESTGDNASFSAALDAAKANNRHGAFVDSQSADTLNSEGTRTFMSEDGMAGAAVKKDGDIVGVFKNSASRRGGAMGDLIITALSNGGNKLDCYGKQLGDKYTQLGFIPVARMDFNPEYATDWKPEYGTPDVIFWMHNGDAPSTVAEKYGSYQTFDENYIKSLPTFTDYDEAYRYRDSLIESRNTPTTSPSPAFQADPTRVNAQTAGYTPLNIEGALQRLNPASQALRQSVERLQSVYPMPQPTLQTAQQTSQAAQPRVQPTLQTAQPTQQTSQPRVQPTLQTAAQASMDALRRVASPELEGTTFGANTVGAAQSGYTPKQNVSRVSSNTFRNSRLFNEAEKQSLKIFDEEGDALYDVITERQSLQNAQDRLEADYEGEVKDLPNKPNFSGEDNDTAMGILSRKLEEARKTGNYDDVNEWAKMIKEKGTEAGQFIQSFAKYSRTPEGVVVQGQREIDAAIKYWQKKNPKQLKKLQRKGYLIWTNEDIQKSYDLMQKAEEAGVDTRQGLIYEAQAMRVIADRLPSSNKDKLVTLLMDNMLGNFRTLVARNAGGNALFAIPEGVRQQLIEAPLDAITSLFTKSRTTYFSPIKKTGAWFKGLGKGTADMASDIRHGVHTARSGEQNSVRAQQRTFRNKGLGRLGNLYDAGVGTMLEIGDRPFYEATYAAAMADLQKARDRGRLTKDFEGKDFDTYAPQVARQAALEAVFQNDGLVARGLTKAAEAIGDISRGITGTGALRQSAIPFTKTPGNLAERAIEYSPLGGLKNIIQTGAEVKSGTFDQRRFVRETSRNLVGTLLFIAAGKLVEGGILGGQLSDDKDEKEAQKNAGMQDYAIKIGDNYYSYSWIPVIGPALAGSADFYQILNNTDKNLLDAMWEAAEGYVQSAVFEQSALSNLEEMFSGYGGTMDNIGSTLASVSSQLVPSLVRQIAAARDPYERQTYVSGDTLQSQLNYLQSSIPGLREKLPIKRDEQGNEKLASQGRGLASRILENMFLPAKVTADQSNAVRDELMRLKKSTGEVSQFQNKVTYAVERDGQKVSLTPHQSMEYQRIFGQMSTQAIEELMNSGVYDDLSDAQKVKVITEINSYAKTIADSNFADVSLDTAQQKAHDAQEMGIGLGLYYAFKDGMQNIKEANKGSEDGTALNIGDIVDMMESGGFADLTEEQKDFLFDSAGYSIASNPYHISSVEQAAQDNAYYQNLTGDDLYYFRSLANEYEDAVQNGKSLDGWVAKAKLAADNGVVEPYQFAELRHALLYADTDENGSYKQSEVTAAINSLSGLTDDQKAYLWQAQNKQWKASSNPFGYAEVYWPETEDTDNSAEAVIDRRTAGMGGSDSVEVQETEEPAQETGINPVAAGPGVSLGDVYGWRDPPAEGASSFHQGNDIPAPMGTPVVAYKSGTVSYVGDGGSGGNMVQIDHPDGTQSVYLHLQNGSFKVSPGQTVSQGQQIANVGSTGVSTGPHLDFRIKVNGEYVDPRSYYPGY